MRSGKPKVGELKAHERRWLDAEAEEQPSKEDLSQTWSSGGAHGVAPPLNKGERSPTSSDTIPSSSGDPGSFKPGELASENK